MMTLQAHHLLIGLCVAWLGASAQAQVTRCTDARTGKVTYTDGTCSSGEAVRKVEIRTPLLQQVPRYQQLSSGVPEREPQRLSPESDAVQSDVSWPQSHARSPECARSQGAYDLMHQQGRHRLSQEHGPLMDSARRTRDINCLGAEAYAERERQQERDRREQEYREAALRRDTELRDQLERDRYQREERERERDRERQREEARKDQERRDQAERDRRAAAERARNESRPVSVGAASNSSRGGQRSSGFDR